MGPINENKIKKWVQQPKTGPVIFPQTILCSTPPNTLSNADMYTINFKMLVFQFFNSCSQIIKLMDK